MMPTLHIAKRGLHLNLQAQAIFKGSCDVMYIGDGKWVIRKGDRFSMDSKGRLKGSDFTGWLMGVTSSRQKKTIVSSFNPDLFFLVENIKIIDEGDAVEKVKKQRVITQNTRANKVPF